MQFIRSRYPKNGVADMSAIRRLIDLASNHEAWGEYTLVEQARIRDDAIAELEQKDRNIDYAFGILEKLAKMIDLLGGAEYKELLQKVSELLKLRNTRNQ